MSLTIPRRLGLLIALTATLVQPARATPADEIAILLPQKGRLSQVALTIRDGLLAAYYQDSKSRTDTPRLRFYDSSDTPAPELVDQAVRNGADAIIGPLEREHVQALVAAGSPPVPVIALNRADGSQPNLFQLALAPEDEISALARWMHQRGFRHPHLLMLEGDNAAQRFLQLFDSAWKEFSSAPAPRHVINATQKGGVAAAIKLLKDTTKGGDSYFLASPAIAGQVQPALTYYSNTLPVFTLASAWDPGNDSGTQQDLEGLGFCGLPWLLDSERPEQTSLYEAQARPAASYDRLYALGADAWSALQSLEALRHGKALPLRTGLIHLDSRGQLVSLPTCAEIRHGMATVMFTPAPPRPPESGR